MCPIKGKSVRISEQNKSLLESLTEELGLKSQNDMITVLIENMKVSGENRIKLTFMSQPGRTIMIECTKCRSWGTRKNEQDLICNNVCKKCNGRIVRKR